MQSSNNSSSDVEALVEREHKRMSTQVVVPALGTMNLLMLTAYWSSEPLQLAVILHALLLGTVANIWMTSKDRSIRIFGRTYRTRDDRLDFIRWSYNLLVTDALQLLFVVNDPMGHLATWLILGLSAQIDTFRKSTRFITIAFGFLMGFVPFVILYGSKLSIATICYAAASYVTTSLIFLKFERTWVNSLRETVTLTNRATEAQIVAEKMRSEAIIGFQQRVISHELSNLMTIIGLNSQLVEGRAGEAIGRAVSKFNSINALVLDKYRNSSKKKLLVIKDLLADVDLLIRKVAEVHQIDFVVEVSDDAAALAFEEYDGASYFIIQNVVKNAIEAAADSEVAKSRSGKIELTVVADVSSGTVRLTVEDNGVGMSPERLDNLVHGRAATSKQAGHGIGSKLVYDECVRNGFVLGAASELGRGTSVWIDIKVANLDKMRVAA